MYGLSENGCMGLEEFQRNYPSMFNPFDRNLPQTLDQYVSSKSVLETPDQKSWVVKSTYGFVAGVGMQKIYEFCPVGASLCMSRNEFMAKYPSGSFNSLDNYIETEYGNGAGWVTNDGNVYTLTRDDSGNELYCLVQDQNALMKIFGTSPGGEITAEPGGTDTGTGTSQNIPDDDLDCCDYCNETEQITEETWYLSPACLEEPCYPLNIDITKIKCVTPNDGMNYEFDCDDIETAISQINAQRGVQGMNGLRDCDCNSMMGLGNATDVVSQVNPYQYQSTRANNDYVLNKVCLPANHNGWLWLLGGTLVGIVGSILAKKGN